MPGRVGWTVTAAVCALAIALAAAMIFRVFG